MFLFFLLSTKLKYNKNTHNVSDVCFALTSFQIVFVKNPTRVELGRPDKLLVVKQNIHPDNPGIVLDVRGQPVSEALVKGIQEAADLGVVGHVEHSFLRSCR